MVCKILAIAQESQEKQVSKYGKYISFTVGDKTWLSTKSITTDQLSRKLDNKIISVFKVIKNKRILVELQIPQLIKIYNVFHPNLLRKVFRDPLTNQINDPPSLVIVNNKEE